LFGLIPDALRRRCYRSCTGRRDLFCRRRRRRGVHFSRTPPEPERVGYRARRRARATPSGRLVEHIRVLVTASRCGDLPCRLGVDLETIRSEKVRTTVKRWATREEAALDRVLDVGRVLAVAGARTARSLRRGTVIRWGAADSKGGGGEGREEGSAGQAPPPTPNTPNPKTTYTPPHPPNPPRHPYTNKTTHHKNTPKNTQSPKKKKPQHKKQPKKKTKTRSSHHTQTPLKKNNAKKTKKHPTPPHTHPPPPPQNNPPPPPPPPPPTPTPPPACTVTAALRGEADEQTHW